MNPARPIKLLAALLLVFAAAGASAQPVFVQTTITYFRVSDNLQTGSEIIPPSGLSRTIPRDRRFVLATSARDNQSGVASITLTGGFSESCTNRLTNTAANRQGTLFTQSDEVRNGTSAAGNPPLRSARFTFDLFAGRARRTMCTAMEDASTATLTPILIATSGSGLTTRSPPITLTYPAQAATGGLPLNAVCGNKTVGQIAICAAGRTCDFRRSTVCSGWWIFRTCDRIQTTDMFCL